MLSQKFIDRFRVSPSKRPSLRAFPTGIDDIPELRDFSRQTIREKADALLKQNLAELADAQELLWASDSHSVLVVFQAMDAAGKDGTIKHVMTGVNPAGCRVVSFKQPTSYELDHNFLWRCWIEVPERGQIVIFNRSHYEDVLVVKVHPELLAHSKLPPGINNPKSSQFWNARYQDINAFERHLARNGTLILKFFLHISKAEQKRRFLSRLDNPEKHWKFSINDLHEREHWDDYINAYQQALHATSTPWAPWYVIPADHKPAMRALVSEILTTKIRSLKLRWPVVSSAQKKDLALARRRLEREAT